MDTRIKVEIVNGVADVRLARPEKMNALDSQMFSALIDTGEELKRQSGLRAVVLSGEGRAFCAGLDMASFAGMASAAGEKGPTSATSPLLTEERTPGGANRAQQAVMVWREIPVPVIAAVHGVAFGGGFQLTLGADLRFVTADLRMSIMEIRWGLVPDMAGVLLLRRLVRDDVARELTFSGRRFTGEEAHALGLATRVCADPREEALAFASEVAAQSPSAIRAGKRLLSLPADMDAATVLLAESREQAALIGSPDQVEAVSANLQKRPAVYFKADLSH